ncbi:MAG: hypothetical protein QOF58_2948 [Pseudonocardiales bacterium]|jgi:hypothetical protein|nr:hypothetical protein [Pseudonocardiales bacterium]
MITNENPYADVPDELYDQLVHAPHAKPQASGNGGSCVTIAAIGGFISIQDDKLGMEERRARTQVYTPAEFGALVADAKAGLFDHLI